MKVRDLIEQLQQHDPHADVVTVVRIPINQHLPKRRVEFEIHEVTKETPSELYPVRLWAR